MPIAARVDALESLEAEAARLRDQVEELRPKAEAYDGLKATLADIELDARARAAQLVSQAEEEAASKRDQAKALLDQVLREYARVGSGADSAITDVICRLTDLRASLAGLSALQKELEAADHE